MNKKLKMLAANTNITLTRLLLVLLAIALFSIVFQEIQSYRAQRLYGQAEEINLLQNRMSALSSDLQAMTLEGLHNIQTLVAIARAAQGRGGEDQYAYRDEIQRYMDTRTEMYGIRYIPAGGAPIESGSIGQTPTAGEAGSPFTSLRMMAIKNTSIGIVVSNLALLRTRTIAPVPLIYVYAPVLEENAYRGAYEIAFDLMPLFAAVHQAERPDESLLLLDNSGRYLVANDGTVRLSESFFTEYPSTVTKEIFGENTQGSFIYDGSVFSYRHIMTPGITLGISNVQYWVIVDIVPTRILFLDTRIALYDQVTTAISTTLIVLVIIVLFIMLVRRNRHILYETDT